MSKILFLSNHFITLHAFRWELINKLIEDHHEVYLSLPESSENEVFVEIGCKIIPTTIDRRGINPIKDIFLLRQYYRMIKQMQPDVVFSYTIKPNIYGSLVSNFLHVKQINNITGTGGMFINDTFLSKIAKVLYRLSLREAYKVFFQNSDDQKFFVENKMVGDNYALLPGSGVNLDKFLLSPLPQGNEIRFIFIGRVMGIKGIDEYLKCAEEVKKVNPNTTFYIAGFIEEEKYESLINQYSQKGIINYIGFQKNISEWIMKCHCTILPSHGGEGTPNALLESAAMGRTCIASNINGSRDVIEDSITGYLFEKKNADSLIECVTRFTLLSDEEKEKMGLAARKKVETEFDRKLVVRTYIDEINKVAGSNENERKR